jgi:hypothetical protein
MKIPGDIRNFVFIASVNDTGNKLLTGVGDIGHYTFHGINEDIMLCCSLE